MQEEETTSITLRIPEAVKEELKQIAKEEDLSLSQLIRRLSRKHLENKEAQATPAHSE